ncbi:hypothetical protein CICLE_v10018266mg [Citrus x clementina]|uniref:FAR1 domain-containing protein n=1 Tax=Citrus clementina TaxID=85681 RepID=V4TF85_CITCL|nr:hypothetical protein CICLE_v10018266mg [Citrus x clementina]
MNNSNEEQEDRDDLEYPVTIEADIYGQWNVSSNDEGEAHNDDFGSIELQTDINNEMGTNQTEIDQQQCREFESEEQAETYYRQYARKAGFGVRRHNIRRNVNGNITGRTWVCSREGFRPAKYLQKKSREREARPLTRTSCQAQFCIILNSETNR